MIWNRYDDINSIPNGEWERLISKGDVTLDRRLLSVAQKVYSDTKFHYFVCDCAIFMAAYKDGVVQTGCDETSGAHFWYDVPFDEFVEKSSVEIRKLYPEATMIYRDFIGDYPEFERVLDLSIITIPAENQTFDLHLKYKYRYQIAQYRAALDRNRYTVESVVDFIPLIDILYPLYVEVSERAKEYSAMPHKKEYFQYIKDEFGDDAVMITIRDTDEYLGFMLLLYTERTCVHQYIGFKRIDDLFLWHNLTIESIEDALRRGVRHINMGVTNAVAKRKFGAVNQPCYNLVRKFKTSIPSG